MSFSTEKVCTREHPAPKGDRNPYFTDKYKWNLDYNHPDAVGRCLNGDYDDWRYECPHCDCYWIYEGPDA